MIKEEMIKDLFLKTLIAPLLLYTTITDHRQGQN